MTQKKTLYDFLLEAELSQYHKQFLDELKVTTVSQVKYVTDVDLLEIGMTKPEVRRLNKFFKKHCNQGALNKLKEILIRGQEELSSSKSRPGASKSPAPFSAETVKQVIDAESVVVQGLIGEGEFGHVYQGIWKRDPGAKIQVAVKTIKQSLLKSSTSQFLKMMSEVQQLRHENIVCLYGVALAEDSIMLVMELASLRSLLICLSSQSSRVNYPIWTLCDFARQVANGMEFLEKRSLVHRDLSARNVLVFAGNLVKVSDAELTRALGAGVDYYQRNVSFSLKLPAAWLAPECTLCTAFTSASDVWAFGVTLWEMFSYAFQPWAGFTGKQIASAISPAGGSQRLNQPDSCPTDFYQLMQNCWQHSPLSRPTFSQIVTTLKEMKLMRMQVTDDQPSFRADCLNCRMNDVITVLDNKPKSPPAEGMWKGVMESNGRVGFFDPGCTMPFLEPKTHESTPRNKISRKYSSRRSLRSDQRLNSEMISAPQNDLRHLGHVGYDGAAFGDVAFIGHNYDRLPFKVKTPDRSTADARMSTRSLTLNDLVPGGRSFLSVTSDSMSPGTSFDISSGTSVSLSPGTSVFSPDKQMSDIGSFDFSPLPKPDSSSDQFDRDENALDTSFDDFSIPNISGSIGLDLSILDEMMKSFGKLQEAEDHTEIVQAPLSIHEKQEEEEDKEEEKMLGDRSYDGTQFQKQGDALAGIGPDSTFSSVTWHDLTKQEKELSSLSKDTEVQQCDESLSGRSRTVYSARALSDGFTPQFSEVLPDSPIPDKNLHLSRSKSHQSAPPSAVRQRGLRFDLRESQISQSAMRGADGSRMRKDLSAEAADVDERGGVLSKIGGVLSKRTETRIKRSLQIQIPSSSSSSTEFLPCMEKFPSRGQKNVSSSLPRDGSLRSSESAAETRPMSFLREGRSFSKTKAKIKSSVSSVINGRSASRKEPPTNLNVNLPFFDRLREQELEKQEKAKQEELQTHGLKWKQSPDDIHGSANTAKHDRSRPHDQAEARRGDYITRPLGLRTRNFESDSQTDEGIQISHSVPNMRNDFAAGFNQLLEMHDSSHDSEQSSVTHQSDDGIFADDSELDSPEGRVIRLPSRLESQASACCSISQTNAGLGVAVTCEPAALSKSEGAGDLELVGDRGERYDAQSAVLSCGQLDFYEDAMESVLDRPFSVGSSNLEETATSKVQLIMSTFQNVRVEDCVCALRSNEWDFVKATRQIKVKLLVDQGLGTDESCQRALCLCGWNLSDASTYLRAHPEDQESPEYIHV